METDGREAHTGLEAAIQMRCFLWWEGDGKSLFVRNSSAWRSLFITQARKTSPASLISSRPHSLGEVTGKRIALLCMLMGTVRNDKKCRALLEPGSSRLLSCGPFPVSSSLLKTGAARPPEAPWESQQVPVAAGPHNQPVVCACTAPHSSWHWIYSLKVLDWCPNTFILGKGQVNIHRNVWACTVDTSCSIK